MKRFLSIVMLAFSVSAQQTVPNFAVKTNLAVGNNLTVGNNIQGLTLNGYNIDAIATNSAGSKIAITNGTAVNLTVTGTNAIGSLTEFNGRVFVERTGLLSDFPLTSMVVQNGSPTDETEAFRAYRQVTLTNDLTGQFSSSYNAWHMNLDGHNSSGFLFPLNGSWLHEGTNGGVNYVIGVNSAGYLDTDSYNQAITNAYNFRGSINNNSTGGSVFIAPRNFYGGFGGSGSFGNPVNIELPNTIVTFTNTAENIRLGMLSGSGKYAIRQTGTATNRWDGPHEFNALTHWGSGAQIYTDTGTAASPALLIDDTDTGFYRNSANAIAVSVGGTSLLWFGTAGIRFSADNTYDIGTSGGNRARDIYAARDFIGNGDIYAASTGQLRFTSRGRFGASTDGEFTLLNNGSTASGSVRFRYYQQSKTADYTATATESGSMFHNGSATGAIVITLPSTHTSGTFYTFQVRAAQSLVVAATNSATITFRGVTGSANNYISSATTGSTVTLVSNGTSWLAIADEGTWSVGGATSTATVYTLGSPQLTSIELGHASDTTLARSGSGVVTIEGVTVAERPTTTVLTYSGTNVTLTATSHVLHGNTLTLTNNCRLTITAADGASGGVTIVPHASTSYTVYLDSAIKLFGGGSSFVVTNSASETVNLEWKQTLRGGSSVILANRAVYP